MIAVAKADPPHRIDHLTFSSSWELGIGVPPPHDSISGEKGEIKRSLRRTRAEMLTPVNMTQRRSLEYC